MALTDKLTAIADAIRSKTGKTDKISLGDMPSEIESISGGSGDVDFIGGFRSDGIKYNKLYATNFTSTSVIVTDILDQADYTKPWEIGVEVNPNTTDYQGKMTISGTKGVNYKNPSLQLHFDTERIWFGYSWTGTSWSIGWYTDFPNMLSIIGNKTIIIRYGWTGSELYYKIYDSSERLIKSETYQDVTNPHYQSNEYPISFGCNYTSNIPLVGTLNILNTYIKSNGQIVWGGHKVNHQIIPKLGRQVRKTLTSAVVAVIKKEE